MCVRVCHYRATYFIAIKTFCHFTAIKNSTLSPVLIVPYSPIFVKILSPILIA